ncbi:hypothetical protein GCM10020255_099090 [Rhodococcus baikonurensis]
MPTTDPVAPDCRERHREHFFVIELKRGHFRTGSQAISTADADRRVDWVSEIAEAVHVPAHCARGDRELVCEFGTGPVSTRLEQ